jgi:hypothetical protein
MKVGDIVWHREHTGVPLEPYLGPRAAIVTKVYLSGAVDLVFFPELQTRAEVVFVQSGELAPTDQHYAEWPH